MGCIIKLCGLFLIAIFIAVPVTIAMNAIQDRPALKRPGEINLQDLKNAQQLAKRYDPRLMPPERITEIRATTRELNTVLKGVMGSLDNVATQVKAARFGVLVGISVKIPETSLGQYLNIRTIIASSSHGLRFFKMYVGKVEIPRQFIRPALRYALDNLVGKGKADPILDSVRAVKVLGPTIYVKFQPPKNLIRDLKTAAQKRIQVSSPQAVKPYYSLLDKLGSQQASKSKVSLTQFLRPLFKLAGKRSVSGDPVKENEAALLALSLYFGDPRFERFVGKVLTPQQKSSRKKLSQVRLNGRHDFVQHFAISVGLALTGGENAANIIGELKEVKDAAGKKSGFSFTDIGADRMGVQFAKKATKGRSKALEFQRVISTVTSERRFFPIFTDLPEGMATAQFRKRYGDVNSPKYKKVISEIDRRIKSIGLYR